MPLDTAIEPTAQDLDDIISALRKSWTSSVTVRRQSKEDVGYREIVVSVDGQRLGILHHGDELTQEVAPGRHTIQAHNTLFRKSLDFTVGVGERVSFLAINRAGWGTYSVWAFWIGFLGAGPLYVTLEREASS